MGNTVETPRRKHWWLIVGGGFLILLGVVGFIGNIARPAESYWRESYGAWGLALSLVLDAVFVGVGALLWVRGRSGARIGHGIVDRVDAFATRAGEQSAWRGYSPSKRRIAASLLTFEAALVSFGASWLLSRRAGAGAIPWFIGGAVFVWMTSFIWGLTIDPTKAAKWGLLLGVPFIFVVGVGGSLLWLAFTS